MATRVLVVDDDPTVSNVVSAYLTKAGYDSRVVADGVAAVEVWQQWKPSVVVLDVMLPGLSGLEVLRRMRAADDGAAVIMLSARGEEEDRLVGLEVGADDYVVKPFSPRELTLRVQAMLRREERLAGLDLTPTKLSAGPVTIDTAARIASLDGVELSLTHREFDLLTYLVSHPGKAYTKAELLRRVWGWDFGDSSTVTVHVRRLREKIEADPSDPKLVLTVPRTGYRFVGESASGATSGPGGESDLAGGSGPAGESGLGGSGPASESGLGGSGSASESGAGRGSGPASESGLGGGSGLGGASG